MPRPGACAGSVSPAPETAVLHVATVHYGSPRWIDIQLAHLHEHISVPFTTWTSLEKIDPSHGRGFDHVIDQAGQHAGKLNHLAMEIAAQADPEDLLMFLDGDAFPIADPMPLVQEALSRAPLVAVRRDENLGDRQPHPLFCVTTVGTWRELGGDWSAGYVWEDRLGRGVSDVGGNLLRQLELSGTPWVEVERSNARDLDPIFFGVYGGVIYHHGAGFRDAELTRLHRTRSPRFGALPGFGRARVLTRRRRVRRREQWEQRTSQQLPEPSQRMYARIAAGGRDWLDDVL
jgi:hypothetical protein